MNNQRILDHISGQIEKDVTALTGLQPDLDWRKRVMTTASRFIPGIIPVANDLIAEVEDTLNSPKTVRAVWSRIRKELTEQDRTGTGVSESLIREAEKMDSALAQESNLISLITGETVSKQITGFLLRHFALKENNRSTYPDMYFADNDYSELPQRSKGLAQGPALRGTYPTSIPDGLEIKSNRGERIRVDCHHDHQGLHLALTFDKVGDDWRVYDLYLAYLSKTDYKRASRNTTATTDKFSFGHAPFISLTGRGTKQALLTFDTTENQP